MKGGDVRSVPLILLMSLFLATHAFAAKGGKLPKVKKQVTTVSHEKPQLESPTDIVAVLSCFGYGYQAEVLINGRDTGIRAGRSESFLLFTQDNKMAKETPPETREKYFILKEGENQIRVDFTKQGSENDMLSIWLEIEGYPAPVFFLHSKSKGSGKVEKKFIVEKGTPKDFKPVYVSDTEEKRSAFVYVSTMGAAIQAILNGQIQHALAGTSGPIPLENIKPGENELVITYKGNPAQAKELRFAIITPQWTQFFVRRTTDSSERTEKFTFAAK
jgi:hypothetical protein